jgi:5-methylcytosine-specific restriction endonuclease McrA
VTTHAVVQCPYCETLFKQQQVHQRFCSQSCTRSYHRDKQRKNNLSRVACDECGAEFMQRNKVQRFCTRECGAANLAKSAFLIFERDSFSCFWCGKSSFEDRAELHLEHVFPLVAGGSDRAENLVTSCRECNLGKGSRILSKPLIERVLREVRRRNAQSNLLDQQHIKTPRSKE